MTSKWAKEGFKPAKEKNYMTSTARYTTINGEIISEKRNGVRSLYVPDPLGSTRALINSSQTQTDTFSYWPYGEVQNRAGTTPTPFQFVGIQGYYKDASASTTSRCYVRARYLDLAKGRWLTRDRIGLTRETNLYLYANNNSVTLVDPSGMFVTCIACGICIGGAAIAAIVACANDPQGMLHCLTCWCKKNRLLCGVLVVACSAACIACIPALGPILGGAGGGVPVPAQASVGGNGQGNDQGSTKTRPCNSAELSYCEKRCDAMGSKLSQCIGKGPDDSRCYIGGSRQPLCVCDNRC